MAVRPYQRSVDREELDMSENYTCKQCGARELDVIREYTVTWTWEETLPCECGEVADGIAAVFRGANRISYEDHGTLIEDHREEWDVRGEKTEEERDTDQEETEVFCQACFDENGSNEHAWEHGEAEADDDGEYSEDDEWSVRCSGCNREVEFGWSNPDRGGRIWPAECSDFNPWKCFPEARYHEEWRKRGWLRPAA